MKKTIAVLLALASAAVFAAGMGDVRITFSSSGPDKYADGTTVLDGEWYALVCIKGDSKQIVDAGSLAVGGRCPWRTFCVKSEDVGKYAGGVLAVCLLDTRDFTGDPTGLTLTTVRGEDGYPVYNAMAIASGEMKASGGFGTASADVAISAGAYDLEAARVPTPKVTGINVEGDEVLVTVSDTVPFVGYTLESGDTAFNFMVLPKVNPVSGDASNTITLKAPKAEGGQFFKVSSIK